MAKGDVFPSEKRQFTESAAGVKAIQFTDGKCHNENPYYNQEGFVGGSERYVFTSNRSGVGQIYAVDVKSGKIVQLTDGSDPARSIGMGGSSGITVDSKRGIAYFGTGRQIYSLDVETMREEVVAESPKGCGPIGGSGLSSEGRYLVLGCQPEGASSWSMEGTTYRHGSEAMIVLCDVVEDRQEIVYHGPSFENRAARTAICSSVAATPPTSFLVATRACSPRD